MIAGIGAIGIGLTITLAGMIEFRSLKRINGLDSSTLITTGIYKWSRNPQYMGWSLTLLGISIMGKSGLALLLTTVLIISVHLYNIKLEEPHLERIFGKEYYHYKLNTPRYIGIPRRVGK
ncbi:phosphatidylethanolamine N-methyltransferase family protein [SCandidatus Aminicenantes bacterium Aminicenantia_JdfR_composite]|nr:phosphatidylethanolamine N-methyltransferase family protein [SCandidatus Aminicenantes bacterium Aminicenantia_JdfR_composite]MCP2606621.1 phosphatidylethanolamine N-methyltransferase family protein [Candidatus Aminicenantes bacterium AC-708-I09]